MEISKISERIKERRKELNMTQKDLADAMHVSNQLISKWETGESVPSLEYLQQLSEALQTSAQELMGLREAPAPSETAPAEPKQKAPSKAKEFWKKNRKALIISIVSVAAALIILTVALLSVFVFAPSANKERYLENIDKGIDKYLERGYYNIKASLEVDGDEDKNPDILQGYLDENGNAVYYNSKTDEIVKDKILTHKKQTGQSDYVQPASVQTVSDLLKEQLKTWGDDDDDFDLDDVTYIRKSGGVYYLKFSEDYFFEDFTPSEKKNIELTEPITGRAEMDGDVTKSIEVSVRYRNIVDGEKFSVDSKIEFLQTKPEIEHENYVSTVGEGVTDMAGFLSAMNAVSVDKDSASMEALHNFVNNRLRGAEGYVWTYSESTYISGSVVALYDPETLAFQKTISINRSLAETFYQGYLWYVDGSHGYLMRVNVENTSAAVGFLTGLNPIADYHFNGKYLYTSDFVYDLETRRKTVEDSDKSIRYVDRDGRVYCRVNGGTLFLYGSAVSLKGKTVLKEEDGFVYTLDEAEPTVLYKYKAGVLQGTVTLPSSAAIHKNGYCFQEGSNKIYDENGSIVKTFENISLKAQFGKGYLNFVDAYVITVFGDYVLVGFEEYVGDAWVDYYGIYRIGEWDAPAAYVYRERIESTKLVQAGDYLYLALSDHMGISHYNYIDDLILVHF